MQHFNGKRWACAAAALFVLAVAGCNNCEKMVEKVCGDLGPDDCAVWKRNGLDKSFIPTGRGTNSTCGRMMSGSAYEGLIKGARQQVAAARNAEKAKAKAGLP
jgi:hypothetical protein